MFPQPTAGRARDFWGPMRVSRLIVVEWVWQLHSPEIVKFPPAAANGQTKSLSWRWLAAIDRSDQQREIAFYSLAQASHPDSGKLELGEKFAKKFRSPCSLVWLPCNGLYTQREPSIAVNVNVNVAVDLPSNREHGRASVASNTIGGPTLSYFHERSKAHIEC